MDFNATTYGVSHFVFDQCFVNGKSGSQLGMRLNWFDGNLTVTNSEFTSVGWGIIVCERINFLFSWDKKNVLHRLIRKLELVPNMKVLVFSIIY